MRHLRQEPDQERGCRGRRRDHRRRRLRGRPRLDEHGRSVRRGVVHLPERLVLEDLEGLACAREELLLRRHDDRGHVRQGNCRDADDQAPGEGGGAQGDARRLDRELRHGADCEHDAGSRGLRRRERHGTRAAPDRQRHDGRGHGHGLPQPQGQGSRGRHPGDDRRDVRRWEQLQARRRGRPLADARLTDSRAASCRACRPTRRGVRSQRSTATAASTVSSSASVSSGRPNRSSPSSAWARTVSPSPNSPSSSRSASGFSSRRWIARLSGLAP